ncbi:MAG: cobalamin-independent methionine synthase II family protein [Xanthobacteraceae bacterium]|nr:cobalamin-independent methionine synthase II family protein [Xanthobacteraceae bacterium]
MKSSTDRIITTHAGSLPRPPELLKLIKAKGAAQPYDEKELEAEIKRAVETTTKRQADLGLDVISDGEMSKPSFLGYITERLGGVRVTTEPFGNPWKGSRENNQFPEYYAWEASLNLNPASGTKRVICDGPMSYKGQRQIAADIATFKGALAKLKVQEPFLPAISPTNVEFWIKNEHYKSDEEYIFALADAMHEEYKAITDAGLLLQIDDPRLVTQYVIDANMSLEDCRKWAEVRVEALNHALRGLPEQQIRFHTCYSIDMGPRTNDMELKNIIDIILKIRAGAYSFEGANPRHEHEWKVWGQVDLPRDKLLIPGVITHSTVLVEHPELICDRILRYASVVGRERVIAGADCGFGTFAGSMTIHPTVAWAKLDALVKGARLASAQLWGAGAKAA